jgi:hypothetical protein
LDLEVGQYLQLDGPETLKLSIIERANHE